MEKYKMKDFTPKMKTDFLIICIMTVLLVIIGVIGLMSLPLLPDDTQNENTATFEDLLEFVNQSENNTTMFDAFIYVDNSTGMTYRVCGFDGTIVGMDVISK